MLHRRSQAKLIGSFGNSYHDPTGYRSFAGALQYLTFIRHDMTYVVQQVYFFINVLKTQHMYALKCIIPCI